MGVNNKIQPLKWKTLKKVQYNYIQKETILLKPLLHGDIELRTFLHIADPKLTGFGVE